MSDQERIERLEAVLGTLILWLYREIGESGVAELHQMLSVPLPSRDSGSTSK